MTQVVVLIIIIILLLYLLYRSNSSKKSKKNKKEKNENGLKYTDLVGHQNDNITKKLIDDLENKEEKTLEDGYDLLRINLYNRQNLDDARRNLDFILNNLTETQERDNTDIVFHIFNDVNHIIAPNRLPDVILDNNAQNKRENIDITHQTDRQEISNIYFNETPVHNDPQNVHESEVNKFYKNRFQMIKQKNSEEANTTRLDTLPIYIMNMADKDKSRRAQKTYLSMLQDAPISSLNSTEMQVLGQVWQRIHSEENEDRKPQLIISLLDQLADATENSIVVCTSGKCLRTLDSLTLLDREPLISNPPKTKEIIRKEIFETASNYLQKYLDKNEEIANLYNKPEIDLTAEENKKVSDFVKNVQEGFGEKIHKDYNDSGISKEVIDTILVEANVGF